LKIERKTYVKHIAQNLKGVTTIQVIQIQEIENLSKMHFVTYTGKI